MNSSNDTDWASYGGDLSATRFRESAITRSNLKDLAVVAKWDLPIDQPRSTHGGDAQFGPNEGTPLKIGSALYTVCAPSVVAKFDLETMAPAKRADGEPVVYDPELDVERAPVMIGFLHRGLAHWNQGDDHRLFLACGDATLRALDLNLNCIKSFGCDGCVDVAPNDAPRKLTITSPPAICDNVVIVGSAIGDLTRYDTPARGDVRAFDALTGDLLWSFETIPTGDTILGQPIDSDWADGSNKTAGHANVWAPMTVDADAGLVYLPVSGAYNDSYGGARPGDNRFSQSLVAVDVHSGEVRWAYQLIRHDVWDYDPPAAPVLVDVDSNGATHKLVVQVTKQAFAYVFNRLTGEPHWPIEDCAVPQSTVPGEVTAAMQPVPTKPLPFDQQGVYLTAGEDLLGRPVDANVNSLSDELRQQITDLLQHYEFGSLYTPPTMVTESNFGTIQFPGYVGGASWAGAVADTARDTLYVSSITKAHIGAVVFDEKKNTYFSGGYGSWGVRNDKGSFQYPLLNPPWGRITAIDLATGEQRWQQPVGEGPREALSKEFKDINLPEGELGWPRRVHLLATTHVLFAAQEAERKAVGYDPVSNLVLYQFKPEKPQLRSYDPDTGELLATTDICMNAQGALMHFVYDGQEYIAIPVGGFDLPSSVVIVGING